MKQGRYFQITQRGEPVEACARFLYKGYQVSMSTCVEAWDSIAVVVFADCGKGAIVWSGTRPPEALAWIDARVRKNAHG